VWPYDLNLGPFYISLYGLMVGLGVAAGLFLTRFSAPLAGLNSDKAFNLAFWLILAGLVGSRAAYVLNNLGLFAKQPLDSLMYWKGGLMFQGGLAGGLIALGLLVLAGRAKLFISGDALAPGLALGQAIGRLGCLAVGCCYGRPAPSWFPLGMSFRSSSVAPFGQTLYPTQATESIGLFILTAFLMHCLRKKTFRQGTVMAMYLTGTGLLRLLMEFFRGDHRGQAVLGLAPTSWAALAIFISGLTIFWYLKTRPVSG
jgi:phosphatidylglycerol:prolipoprotein diacylglycerol transferase